VYYYYPRRYPVYYYPYPSSYAFDHGFFWGVTTAFTIGWISDGLHVYHHSYYGHPYFGRSYWWDRWWYRRPSISVYNTSYVLNRSVTINRYYHGDIWRPRPNRRDYIPADAPRIATNRHYPSARSVQTRQGIEDRVQTENRRTNTRRAAEPRDAGIRNDLVRNQSTQARRENTIREQLAEARAEPRTEPGVRNATERREAILRQLRRGRDDVDVRQRSQARREVTARGEPVARATRPQARSERTVHEPQRQVRREPVVRQSQPQRQVRREPAVRQVQPQRQVRREQTVRQVQPQPQVRREPTVRNSQPQRQERAASQSQPRQRKGDSGERARRERR
jgi:hypothetical protein